jgi:hypothetical protein
VPGLPEVVTQAEAEGLGMLDALEAAIANGNYKAVKATVTKEETAEEA